jgi:hypothetical protein
LKQVPGRAADVVIVTAEGATVAVAAKVKNRCARQ